MENLVEVEDLKRISTGIAGTNEADDFLITNQAFEKIQQIKEQNEIPEDYFLRISTHSGGCSGMRYDMGFDEKTENNDRTFLCEGLNVVIDSASLFYVQGVRLEFQDDEMGSGFVFNNPNNSGNCGCSC
jgi:iron-sulfur cluster assembly protein